MTWWDFGEHSGYSGNALATFQISCPFCPERGNFKVVHHETKKNSAGKKLNYDILQCENCGNLTMAFGRLPRVAGYTITKHFLGREAQIGFLIIGRKMSGGIGCKLSAASKRRIGMPLP